MRLTDVCAQDFFRFWGQLQVLEPSTYRSFGTNVENSPNLIVTLTFESKLNCLGLFVITSRTYSLIISYYECQFGTIDSTGNRTPISTLKESRPNR